MVQGGISDLMQSWNDDVLQRLSKCLPVSSDGVAHSLMAFTLTTCTVTLHKALRNVRRPTRRLLLQAQRDIQFIELNYWPLNKVMRERPTRSDDSNEEPEEGSYDVDMHIYAMEALKTCLNRLWKRVGVSCI